jgi:hypothetical protein
MLRAIIDPLRKDGRSRPAAEIDPVRLRASVRDQAEVLGKPGVELKAEPRRRRSQAPSRPVPRSSSGPAVRWAFFLPGGGSERRRPLRPPNRPGGTASLGLRWEPSRLHPALLAG